MADDKRCFYCGANATSWVVKVGNRDYPVCRDCRFSESHKDGYVTRPK